MPGSGAYPRHDERINNESDATMIHRLVNLTQHPLRIKTATGSIVTVRSAIAEGKALLPHVEERRSEVEFKAVLPDDPNSTGPISFFMYEIDRGQVRNIPPPKPGTLYVVGMRVLEALRVQYPERNDFITPGNVERQRGVIQHALGFHYLV